MTNERSLNEQERTSWRSAVGREASFQHASTFISRQIAGRRWSNEASWAAVCSCCHVRKPLDQTRVFRESTPGHLGLHFQPVVSSHAVWIAVLWWDSSSHPGLAATPTGVWILARAAGLRRTGWVEEGVPVQWSRPEAHLAPTLHLRLFFHLGCTL